MDSLASFFDTAEAGGAEGAEADGAGTRGAAKAPAGDGPGKAESGTRNAESETKKKESSQPAGDKEKVADPLPFSLEDEGEGTEAQREEETPESREWPESARKRVDQLTARSKTAEEKATALETEVSQLREQLAGASHPQLKPTPEDPLSDVVTFEGLSKLETEAREALSWALANPEGVILERDGKEVEYTPKQVALIKANAEKTLQLDLPSRKAWLGEHAKALQELGRAYPKLMEPGEVSGAAISLMNQLPPELKRNPEWPVLIGDMLTGRAVRSGEYVIARRPKGDKATRQPGNQATSEGAAKAPPVPSSSRPADSSNRGEREMQDALKRFETNPGTEGLADVFAAMDRAS